MNHGTQLSAQRIALYGLGVALTAACTLSSSSDRMGQHPNDYGVDLYEPFDNSRDWGPSYLVGPPLRDRVYPNDNSNRTADSVLTPPASRRAVPSIPDAFPDPLTRPDPTKAGPDSSLPTSPVP